jgi:hypothetical protein
VTSRKYREATTDGADGVVLVKKRSIRLTNTTPSRGEGAKRLSLDRATVSRWPSSTEEGASEAVPADVTRTQIPATFSEPLPLTHVDETVGRKHRHRFGFHFKRHDHSL